MKLTSFLTLFLFVIVAVGLYINVAETVLMLVVGLGIYSLVRFIVR